MDPAGINYLIDPYGKLSLPSHPLCFNLSDSHNRIALAFTLETDVGVDIEQVHPLPDLSRMVERWFSPEERIGLAALAPAVQVEAFYHIWTQKEAFIKAHGEGLSWRLKDFSVSIDPNKPGRLLSIKGTSDEISLWKITSTNPEAGCRVAVCVRAEADMEILWHMPEMADFVSSVTSWNSSISV
jgi:4'-phosphopantetheinyl transferase